jgi:hypothetical protein
MIQANLSWKPGVSIRPRLRSRVKEYNIPQPTIGGNGPNACISWGRKGLSLRGAGKQNRFPRAPVNGRLAEGDIA